MKKIDESSIILRFSDDDKVIHDVGLDSILEGGFPIDTESGNDMEYLGVYLLPDNSSSNVEGRLETMTQENQKPTDQRRDSSVESTGWFGADEAWERLCVRLTGEHLEADWCKGSFNGRKNFMYFGCGEGHCGDWWEGKEVFMEEHGDTLFRILPNVQEEPR